MNLCPVVRPFSQFGARPTPKGGARGGATFHSFGAPKGGARLTKDQGLDAQKYLWQPELKAA